MKILHTSDWHLGKSIDGSPRGSRLPEQQKFFDQLIEIADREQVDLVLVAGDVYDVFTPPAAAEGLFFRNVSRLGNNGRRPVIIIAGNHDNPERLTAAGALGYHGGVILLGTPKDAAQPGNYGGYSVEDSGEGFLELEIGGERAVILTMPYPSEKRLGEVLAEDTDSEKEFQLSYSEKISHLLDALSKKFRQDTVNLMTGHFYITGGQQSKTEREIQLGGIYAVDASALPNAQYIAMGHLHRSQKVPCNSPHAYYSGSPIQLGKSEAGMAKCVYVAELTPGKEASVKKIFLDNYCPLEVWKAESIEEAIEMCTQHSEENSWVFLEIKCSRAILASEIKEMHRLKPGLVEISPQTDSGEAEQQAPPEEVDPLQEFKDFYTAYSGTLPTDELVELFASLLDEESGGE